MKTFLMVVMVIAAIPALLIALTAYAVYQMYRFTRENGRWKVCSQQAARIPERFFEEELNPYFNVPPTFQSADRLLPPTAGQSTAIGLTPARSPSWSNTTAGNRAALLLDPSAVP